MNIFKNMTAERKLLILVMALAVTGWIFVAALLSAISAYRLSALNADAATATWRRQAGKAYTEMLLARSGGNSFVALIPKGTRIECGMTISKVGDANRATCTDGILYPPNDY